MMKLLLVSAFAVIGVMSGAPSASHEHPVVGGHLHVRPPMGITTSLTLGCANLTEKAVLKIASGLKTGGYYTLGYDTIFIGSCWLAETNLTTRRGPKEALKEDKEKFPSGISALAKKLHAEKIKLGVTIGGGWYTCEKRQGTAGHEHQDAIFLAQTGVDYVTMDACYADDGLLMETNHDFGEILNIYNSETQFISTYPALYIKGENPADFDWNFNKKVVDISTVYVSESSIPTYQSVKDVLHNAAVGNDVFRQAQTVGSYLDWGPLLTEEQLQDCFQVRGQMSLWALLGAPLIIGGKLEAKIPPDYSNAAVLAVAQDRNPTPAAFMKVVDNGTMWGRALEDGTGVIGLINNSTQPIAKFTLHLGSKTTIYKITELWTAKEEGQHVGTYEWTGTLRIGDSLLFHLSVIDPNMSSNAKKIFSLADITVEHPSDLAHKAIEQTDGDAVSKASTPLPLKSLRDARSTQ